MSGRLEANFHIVIGQVASAKNIEKCITRVDPEKSFILNHIKFSWLLLCLLRTKWRQVWPWFDIGGGTTDLAVYHDGVVRHTAVIPFGGNVIAKRY